MNKQEFIAEIRARIAGLPQEDIDRSLDYYSELIDDYVEDGRTEEQAVEKMGTVAEAVSQILADTPLPDLVKAKVSPKRPFKAWEIVLLILGAPLWVPLVLAAAIIFLSVYIVIWSVVVVFYSVDLSFAAGGLAGIFLAAVSAVTGGYARLLVFFGAGLVCAGLAIMLFFVCNKAAFYVAKFGKMFVLWVKALFAGRGVAK